MEPLTNKHLDQYKQELHNDAQCLNEQHDPNNAVEASKELGDCIKDAKNNLKKKLSENHSITIWGGKKRSKTRRKSKHKRKPKHKRRKHTRRSRKK